MKYFADLVAELVSRTSLHYKRRIRLLATALCETGTGVAGGLSGVMRAKFQITNIVISFHHQRHGNIGARPPADACGFEK